MTAPTDANYTEVRTTRLRLARSYTITSLFYWKLYIVKISLLRYSGEGKIPSVDSVRKERGYKILIQGGGERW